MSKKDYYQNNSDKYIEESITYSMDMFYAFLLKELSEFKNPQILDLGFGSGRDMLFLKDKGFSVEGLDFCNNFTKRMQELSFTVYNEELPSMNTVNNMFDCIYSVGLLMHLTESDISLLFNNLYNKLNDKGVLILSYNDLDRSEDKDRLFFKITKSLINELAAKNNFILEKTEIMIDKRDINWITEKYVKDLKWEK